MSVTTAFEGVKLPAKFDPKELRAFLESIYAIPAYSWNHDKLIAMFVRLADERDEARAALAKAREELSLRHQAWIDTRSEMNRLLAIVRALKDTKEGT